MAQRRTYALLSSLAALALCLPVTHAPTSAAEPVPTDQVTIELSVTGVPANGTSWTAGETVPVDITVTNTSGRHLGLRPSASTLTNYEACRWHWMAPASPQTCAGRAQYVVTETDVEDGTLDLSITYSAYSEDNYSGEATVIGTGSSSVPVEAHQEPQDPDAPVVSSTIEVLSPAPADGVYTLGQIIDYRLVVTNTSNAERSLLVSSSNLDNAWNCRWSRASAGVPLDCFFASHTITASDVEAGSFTPSVTWASTSSPNYQGSLTAAEPTLGETVQVGGPTEFSTAGAFKSPDADPALAPGVSDPLTLAVARDKAYNIRIPAIAVAPNGDLLAAYDRRPLDGGTGGGDSPNANWIVQRRSTDNGKTWQRETVVAQGDSSQRNRLGFSDPSYVVDATTGTVFNFHVQSFDSGVFANNPAYNRGSDGRIDESDRHAMNLGLSVSTDNGHTWTQRVVTAQALHDKTDLRSCFATSGAGIQKKQAPFAGRLVQQIACVRTSGEIVAMSMISDDHGQTWATGAYVPVSRGPGQQPWRFDENKVAELSDGRLILNSRTTNASPGGGHRIVALSEDGGATWSEPFAETQLLDSGNNAQIIRAYPNAAAGSARAKVLLYSGAFNQRARDKGTVLASCDDGKTWSHKRELIPGGTGYTTMTVQPDGSIGLLYEPRIFNDIGYLRFTLGDIAPNLCQAPALTVEDINDVTETDGEEIKALAVVSGGGDPALGRTVSVSGLPEGLSYDAQTATISGRAQAGITEKTTYQVTVTVSEKDDGTGLAPRQASTSFNLMLLPGEIAPVPEPSDEPSAQPEPSDEPSAQPEPSDEPSAQPEPSDEPSAQPEPSDEPSAQPESSDEPSAQPEPSASASTSRAKETARPSRGASLARTGTALTALLLVSAGAGGAGLLMRRQGRRS